MCGAVSIPFLAEIQRQEDASRAQVTGYVELRPGWDSNVASATADSTIDIPAIGVVTLGATVVSRAIAFWTRMPGSRWCGRWISTALCSPIWPIATARMSRRRCTTRAVSG